jgi:hypothetical protein
MPLSLAAVIIANVAQLRTRSCGGDDGLLSIKSVATPRVGPGALHISGRLTGRHSLPLLDAQLVGKPSGVSRKMTLTDQKLMLQTSQILMQYFPQASVLMFFHQNSAG